MGYTHYWNLDNWGDEDKAGYEEALPIIRDIVKRHSGTIKLNHDTDKAPRVTKEFIQFNGRGDDGHETFVFSPSEKESMYTFCKTARKPYDQAVCECLLVLNAKCPNLEISSDGFSGYMEDPKLDGTWPEAMDAVTEYGLNYATVIVTERHPYCDLRPIVL